MPYKRDADVAARIYPVDPHSEASSHPRAADPNWNTSIDRMCSAAQDQNRPRQGPHTSRAVREKAEIAMTDNLRSQRPNPEKSAKESVRATPDANGKRLLLLAGKLGYQQTLFAEAAKRLGAEVVLGTDRCHQLDDPWADGAVSLHFDDADRAAKSILDKAQGAPVTGFWRWENVPRKRRHRSRKLWVGLQLP